MRLINKDINGPVLGIKDRLNFDLFPVDNPIDKLLDNKENSD
ncbi:4270_t:CDS:2 [Entrophospora sp. SA101]|nr:4270_t:CDS:2 [Entrophospora sp. SA101]